MPTPEIFLPPLPLPPTLELDEHTRHFFEPSEWSGPVDAHFKLANPALQGLVFIGRIIEWCGDDLYLVMQPLTGNPKSEKRAPCLIAPITVEWQDVTAPERSEAARQYFSRNLTYPDAVNGADWRSQVPTLGGLTANHRLRRLHFDATTGLDFFFDESRGSIMRAGAVHRSSFRISPRIELGAALFGFEAPRNPLRSFVSMDDALFHGRVQALLQEPECVLYHSVKFHFMDEEERRHFVFGCELATVERALEMFRLVLTVEFGAGGALEDWSEATWRPWAEDGIIGGNDAQGRGVGIEAPSHLLRWRVVVGEKTGCQVRKAIWHDVAGLHLFAREWGAKYHVVVKKPSAHELIEASVQLKEMLG